MSSTDLTLDLRDIQFNLKEWLHVETLSQTAKYKDFDGETIDLLVKEGLSFAAEVIAPSRSEADREGCKMVDGQAVVPACIVEPYKQSYKLGWASLTAPPEYGGQGAPLIVGLAVKEGLLGANLGLSMYFGLTEGAAGLIEAFGTEHLKELFVEKLITGVYTGTMCLSEPQAGSDVGAGTTVAESLPDGRYKIKGTKCWISSGDNNLGSNVIHTVLARIKGAPVGTKGLSLFAVPKYWVNDDGSHAQWNDVTLASLEHKMGINCSTTAVLNFGENDQCYGYLIGQENQGIAQMFKLMNEARMGVAMMGLAIGSAAYQNSLAYAKERIQGPHISNMKDPNAPRVAIIEHPDVRTMLMNMKSRVEAMRALNYATTDVWDRMVASENKQERQELDDFMQILVPMCKGWSTEVGLDVTRIGLQVLGGVGYTKDFPLEQYYRDLRISAIYEGTTGIQALDLVGRKMTMRNGELFMKLLGRFNQLVEDHSNHPTLGGTIQYWGKTCEHMTEGAMALQSMVSERGMEGAALYATSFLMNLSALTAGYFYLQQGLIASQKLDALKKDNNINATNYKAFVQENSEAQFYHNKLTTLHYYVHVVLPTFDSVIEPMKGKHYDALEAVL